MLSYVGLNPRKDIKWVTYSSSDAAKLMADGKIDAYMGFPPRTAGTPGEKNRARVVNSAADRPWSQYFCCMVAGNREFIRKNPVATKRALRAILKQRTCALEPERAARLLVDKGYTTNYDYALQHAERNPLRQVARVRSRGHVRFYALRLHEAGMIKTSPQKIIAQGTDWRILRELKKELKSLAMSGLGSQVYSREYKNSC